EPDFAGKRQALEDEARGPGVGLGAPALGAGPAPPWGGGVVGGGAAGAGGGPNTAAPGARRGGGAGAHRPGPGGPAPGSAERPARHQNPGCPKPAKYACSGARVPLRTVLPDASRTVTIVPEATVAVMPLNEAVPAPLLSVVSEPTLLPPTATL